MLASTALSVYSRCSSSQGARCENHAQRHCRGNLQYARLGLEITRPSATQAPAVRTFSSVCLLTEPSLKNGSLSGRIKAWVSQRQRGRR